MLGRLLQEAPPFWCCGVTVSSCGFCKRNPMFCRISCCVQGWLDAVLVVSCYLDTGCGAFTCLKAVPAWLSTFSVFSFGIQHGWCRTWPQKFRFDVVHWCLLHLESWKVASDSWGKSLKRVTNQVLEVEYCWTYSSKEGNLWKAPFCRYHEDLRLDMILERLDSIKTQVMVAT